jgi:ferredoxin
MDITNLLLIGLGSAILLGFGLFSLTSLREGEARAARIAAGLALAVSPPFFLSPIFPEPVRLALLAVVGLAIVAGTVLFLLPIGRIERGIDVPQTRIDERDIMFARARLEPDTTNYEAYYALRPENKPSDDKTRSLPGLLSPAASEANPLVFAATDATFATIEAMSGAAEGPAAPVAGESQITELTDYVKNLTLYWGAHTVGITELKPYHIYTHVGRGSGTYGAPITLDQRTAIAFTVEMDHTMVGTAPASPTVLESARQYLYAAQIAIQLCNFIRSQGYPARAHIDGNYRVVAPLVARDAGLGEIGRMGLLMTPTLGPRVRLGVVTTDLPLNPDLRTDDPSVLDFCRVCKKCADTCPVRAIPSADRQEIDGALRWRINQDICYRYWCVTGTDCARCMALCPYSYPDSTPHNLVRWAVRHSGAARRAVIWLDGVFYGTAPSPKPAPSWIPPQAPQGDTRPRAETIHQAESGTEKGAEHGTE